MKIILSLFCHSYQFNVIFCIILRKGKWKFVKSDEYCYIGSQAIESQICLQIRKEETIIY